MVNNYDLTLLNKFDKIYDLILIFIILFKIINNDFIKIN